MNQIFSLLVNSSSFQRQRQSYDARSVRRTIATKIKFYGRPPTTARTMAAPLADCQKMLSSVLHAGLA